MGRKNSKVGRPKVRGRYRQETHIGRPKRHDIPRASLEKMVVPDGECRFQTPNRPKKRFATEEKAKQALHQAQLERARQGSTHVEKRVYACPEGGCGGYHLSSREAFDMDIWRKRRELFEQGKSGGQP